MACRCELVDWRATPGTVGRDPGAGPVLTQYVPGFSTGIRTIRLALALAQEAISREMDQQLTAIERIFVYMPFMHSESPRIHEVACNCSPPTASQRTSNSS